MGACGILFSILAIVFSALLICCSGFYWYLLGAFDACSTCGSNFNNFAFYTQFVAIDAVHGGMFVIGGVMGILAGFKLGFPPATVLTLVMLGVIAIGLTVELALVYTIYSCSSGNIYSSAQSILCNRPLTNQSIVVPFVLPAVGPWFGVITYAVPFAVAWCAAISMLFVLICWSSSDGSFSFDD